MIIIYKSKKRKCGTENESGAEECASKPEENEDKAQDKKERLEISKRRGGTRIYGRAVYRQ